MGSWLGGELRRLRLARGLSLRELAHALGILHTSYVAYERGVVMPPPERRAALAHALGITPEGLEDLIEEDQYEVFLRSRRLSEEGKAAVREFLRFVRERERRQARGQEAPPRGL